MKLTLLDNRVVLRNEKGLLAIICLVGLVLGLQLLVDIAAEFLEKHVKVK
jgi:hypothetical protein